MGKRIFISLPLPDTCIATIENRISSELSALEPNVKLVEPKNYHCTLHFLGNITQQELQKITHRPTKTIEKTIPEFALKLYGCGCFPSKENPTVIWLGIEETPQLSKLYQNLTTILTSLLPHYIPNHSFHAHVTLGRVKKPLDQKKIIALHSFLKRYAQYSFCTYTLTHIAIMESMLHPRGPTYEVVKKIYLQNKVQTLQ